MRKAVRDSCRRIRDTVGSVHRLKPEVIEPEPEQFGGVKAGLRIDELQFLAAPTPQRRSGLRADAKPIDPFNGLLRSVCLDRDFKSAFVDGIDQRRVELQQRLPACEDDEPSRLLTCPGPPDSARERRGRFEAAASSPVGPNEIRVAKAANGAGAILLAAGPEIAAAESAEHGGAARLSAFALQRFENFLDHVDHGHAFQPEITENVGNQRGFCTKTASINLGFQQVRPAARGRFFLVWLPVRIGLGKHLLQGAQVLA
jgi:hypothetical protein